MCNFSTETSLLFNEFNEKDIVVVAVTSLRMADFGVGFVLVGRWGWLLFFSFSFSFEL